VFEATMKSDNGKGKLGEGLYAVGSRQAVIAEKRVTLAVEFNISFREITPETAVEMYPSHKRDEVLGDDAEMDAVERQGRLLSALLEDEEALRQFIACAVIEEIVAGDGELLRKELRVESEEAALRSVIDALGGEAAEYYGEVEGGVMFRENIDLVLYSTPVKCVSVKGRVVEIKEEAGGESDNYLM
jgi:hypothetical protein